MENKDQKKYRNLAVRIADNSSADDRKRIGDWLSQLLEIRSSDMSVVEKGKRALSITTKSKTLLPTVRLISKEFGLSKLSVPKPTRDSLAKAPVALHRFWKSRSLPAKLGLSAASLSAIVFGSQGAGIAAFGTAIGVPLWIVFGAGATFAGVLYEELTRESSDPETTYAVIQAKQRDDEGLTIEDSDQRDRSDADS